MSRPSTARVMSEWGRNYKLAKIPGVGSWGLKAASAECDLPNSLSTRIRPMRSTLCFVVTCFWCRKIFGIP